jgi:hypothetical protein
MYRKNNFWMRCKHKYPYLERFSRRSWSFLSITSGSDGNAAGFSEELSAFISSSMIITFSLSLSSIWS